MHFNTYKMDIVLLHLMILLLMFGLTKAMFKQNPQDGNRLEHYPMTLRWQHTFENIRGCIWVHSPGPSLADDDIIRYGTKEGLHTKRPGWELLDINNPCSGGIQKKMSVLEDAGIYELHIVVDGKSYRSGAVDVGIIRSSERSIILTSHGETQSHKLLPGRDVNKTLTIENSTKVSIMLNDNYPATTCTKIQMFGRDNLTKVVEDCERIFDFGYDIDTTRIMFTVDLDVADFTLFSFTVLMQNSPIPITTDSPIRITTDTPSFKSAKFKVPLIITPVCVGVLVLTIILGVVVKRKERRNDIKTNNDIETNQHLTQPMLDGHTEGTQPEPGAKGEELFQKETELNVSHQREKDQIRTLQQNEAEQKEKAEELCKKEAEQMEKAEELCKKEAELKAKGEELRKKELELHDKLMKLKATEEQNQQSVQRTSEHCQELVKKYKREMQLRRKKHNEIVELRGNIRIYCRVRPPFGEDGCMNSQSIISFDSNDDAVINVHHKKNPQSFEMDKVFTWDSSQEQVFQEVKALVTSSIDGFNVCIFAYGQTGSGKTYTMEGTSQDPGINQRALTELFHETRERSQDWKFTINVSMMEVYNENIRDLLSSETKKLDVRMNQEGGHHVPGLVSIEVDSVDAVNKIFIKAKKKRATAATNMNEYISRSHALLCVTIESENETTRDKSTGKLNLIDLAGSENINKSGVEGARLREAQNINKSLTTLGNVIHKLKNKQIHVPYRDSKLTRLLQDSLGGESKTLMIVQVAPENENVKETLTSLKFAQRVRAVELGQVKR